VAGILKKFLGLRNTVPAERFEEGDLEAATNVDLDDTGGIGRRSGYALTVAGAGPHSLWGDGETALFVRDGSLYLLKEDYSAEAIRSGLSDLPVSYWKVADRIYYSNGVQNGVVQNGRSRSWGLPVPAIPAATETVGYLIAGRYQYAITFVREDGQESGASFSGTIDLPAGSGIAFSDIETHAEAVQRRVYVSRPDGEGLYLAATINAADTGTTVTRQPAGIRLETQFAVAAPPGQVISYWKGRMLVGAGNVVYESEPYQYELFALDRGLVPAVGRVTMIAPVEHGYFVGTDGETIFVSRGDDGSAIRTHKLDYGAIPGTLAYADGSLVGKGIQGQVAIWHSRNGVCIGYPDGTLHNVTLTRYRFDPAPRGAAIMRYVEGKNQYLSVLQG
jgi:hypothetical protein